MSARARAAEVGIGPRLGRGTSRRVGEERRVVDTVTYYGGLRRNVRRYDARAALNIPEAALSTAALDRYCIEPDS